MTPDIDTSPVGNFLRERGALLVIPVMVFFLGVLLANAEGPYSGAFNSDPDYPYLLNSLTILSLHTPGHIDHPGTTLQLLGAVVVFCKWIFSSFLGTWAPLESAVLTHPEDYLNSIHLALSFLIGAALYLAGSRMYRASGSLVAALVLQFSVFLFPEIVRSLGRVRPEPLLIATGFALLVPLVPLLLAEEGFREAKAAFTAGAIVGFGLVTKVTFLPWAMVAGLFSGWKQRLRFAVGFLLALVLFLLPIFAKLPDLGRWVFRLLSHSGKYGGGPPGLPASAELLANLKSQYQSEPFLFYWLAYYGLALVALRFGGTASKDRLAESARRLLWAGCGIIVVQTAMSVKHFAPHYILPSLAVTALLNGVLVLLVSSRALRPVARGALAVCGAALLMAGVSRNVTELNLWLHTVRDIDAGARQLAGKRSEQGDCITIGYYRSSAPGYALAFGSGYADAAHAQTLEELYPEFITYNIFSNQFLSFAHRPQEALLRRLLSEGHCLLMQGVGRDVLPAGFSLRQVAITRDEGQGNRENLYRLISLSTGPIPVSAFDVPGNAITLEAERFTEGNVIVDNSGYGAGIGVVLSPKTPAHAVYDLSVPAPGPYAMWARYASMDRRPLTLSINGKIVSSSACAEPTDGWFPVNQAWLKLGTFELRAAKNILRLESVGPFPHLDKFVFVPSGGQN